MSINIGNNNKIIKSTISENDPNSVERNSTVFYQRHPIICAAIAAIIAGFVLMFSFWKDIVTFIENIWGGS